MLSRTAYTARTDGLVVQEFGDELLIYDRRTDVAHCLSSVAARVWRLCEGGASLDEIAQGIAAAGIVGTDAGEEAFVLVETAAAELEEKGLLVGLGSTAEGFSRRHVLRRMAGVGAAALAAPLVVSAAVPKPADAKGSPPTCIGHLGTGCTPANSANSANNCCTSTGDNCTLAGVCTNCLLDGTTVACPVGFAQSLCCSGACKAGACSSCTPTGQPVSSGCSGSGSSTTCCSGTCNHTTGSAGTCT